jgi:hypothetical protein
MVVTAREPQNYPFRRAGTYVPPLLFFGLCLLVLLGAPNLEGRIFYAVMSAATGLWLARSLRVLVRTSTAGLFVRTSYTTRLLPWSEVVSAEVRPMRTMSPLKRVRSYAALAVHLTNGRVMQFDDIAASESSRERVTTIVDHINGWCSGRPGNMSNPSS